MQINLKMADLEKHISEVSRKIDIQLEKTFETTPGVGNCCYEACASLLRLINMRNISAKQPRKEVVDNIENCENFDNFFEMCLNSDYAELEKFKEKHYREGEFTDENGGMVMATAFTLGVTLRLYSDSNSKRLPYTEYNK